MKKNIVGVLVTLIGFGLWYLIGVVSFASFDIGIWENPGRGLIAVFGVFSSVAAGCMAPNLKKIFP